MKWIVTALAGMAAGTLINYLADVLPVTRKFSHPVCEKCTQPFKLTDYVLLRNCRNCKERNFKRTILVLVFTVLLSFLLQLFPLTKLNLWTTLPMMIFLGVIIVIDFEHRLVLFESSIVGLLLFSVYGIILNGLRITLLGGLSGLLIMLAFYFMGKGFTRIIGWLRHQQIDTVAFGFGDVCLGTILGLFTGWPVIIGAIVITMLIFVVFSLVLFVILLLTKKYKSFSTTLPFTVFLILGAITIFYI